MLRLAPPAVLLVLLLSGCASDPAPVLAEAAAAPDWTVTATRVEPVVHELDWRGSLAARLCDTDGGDPCRSQALSAAGLVAGVDWDEPTLPFLDEQALFWRVNATLQWSSDNPLAQGVEFEVRAISACIECPQRVVETYAGASPIVIEKLDVFLEPGETGVLLLLRPSPGSTMETAWGAAAISYEVGGVVGGYRPVADPVELTPDSEQTK